MNELYHHGVKGQEWGIQNGPPYPLNSAGKAALREQRKASRELTSSKRHVGASGRILKTKGKIANEAQNRYDNAVRDLDKENNKFYFSKKKRQQNYDEAVREVNNAVPFKDNATKEYKVARDIYKDDEKIYLNRVKQFDKKYGTNKLSSIKTKTINSGRTYVDEVIRTGINVSTVPVVGDIYSKNYYTKRRRDYLNTNT